MSYILIGCVIFAILYYISSRRRTKGRPIPGPRGLPLIGNFLDVDAKNAHLVFDKWAGEFGAVYYVNVLGQNFVILNSLDSIRAACLKDPDATLLADRPSRFGFKLVFNNQIDIVMGRSGEEQRSLRKIGHRLLKSYGEGILRIQNIATQELEKVTQAFRDTKGASMDPSQHVYLTICNTITTLLVGRTFQHDDCEIEIFRKNMFTGNQLLTPGIDTLLTVLPFLRHLPPFKSKIRDFKAALQLFKQQFITESKSTLDPQNPRGMIDELILHPDVTEEEVDGVAYDMLAAGKIARSAGTMTTYGGIMGLILILLHRHDVQRNIQSEIDDVTGRERMPTMHDRPQMPYTEAVIFEALRYMSHVPLALHSATQDMTFLGYSIKKGTNVVINLWSLHHDERIWGDPWKFRPDRFLDSDGSLLPIDDPLRRSLLTFGVGKRSCIGEMVARIQMFLFTTALLQSFDLEPGDTELPSMEPTTFQHGLILTPQPYTMRTIQRREANSGGP